jgi:hypothetical protein
MSSFVAWKYVTKQMANEIIELFVCSFVHTTVCLLFASGFTRRGIYDYYFFRLMNHYRKLMNPVIGLQNKQFFFSLNEMPIVYQSNATTNWDISQKSVIGSA